MHTVRHDAMYILRDAYNMSAKLELLVRICRDFLSRNVRTNGERIRALLRAISGISKLQIYFRVTTPVAFTRKQTFEQVNRSQ